MKGLLGISLVLALAAGGCDNGDDGSAARTTVPPATSTTTTTPADPYAVPATIDESYVQRVVQKLYEIDGDAMRVVVRDGDLFPPAVEMLHAIYVGEELDRQLESWNQVIRDGELGSFRSPPGNINVTVDEVLIARADCIAARATRYFSPAIVSPAAPRASTIELRPRRPSGVNQHRSRLAASCSPARTPLAHSDRCPRPASRCSLAIDPADVAGAGGEPACLREMT